MNQLKEEHKQLPSNLIKEDQDFNPNEEEKVSSKLTHEKTTFFTEQEDHYQERLFPQERDTKNESPSMG